MWTLHRTDLDQLWGAGGERFAHFVDRLIRAEAYLGGLAQSEVQTQLRVNIPDGGVDTEVKQPLQGDLTGWFGIPTCWQFKARLARDVKEELKAEVHKPYAEELIRKGYGYRLCLLGDVPPTEVSTWEDMLKVEAQKISSGAADPRVVHGGHLIEWGGRFPAVIAWLRQWTTGGLHWEAWLANCRSVTEHYVRNPEWEDIRQSLKRHVTFRSACVGGVPCLVVGGAAGVGKTRLVFETLAELPASPGFVVYAPDEQDAKSIATAIANGPHQIALLVADECGADTRHLLDEILRGHTNRIRVICIDNAARRLSSPASQIWLAADELKNTDAILAANFPEVPADRRNQYAYLSRGFVRIAADMCQRDAQLAGGDLSGMLASVEAYILRHPLLKQHLALVSALALFHKVGFHDDVSSDLDALCETIGRKRHEFDNAVRIIRQSPGFVVQAGRYWYATPEIVARVLFAEGWERWVTHDIGGFLKRLPDHLQHQLIERVSQLGGKEARDQLASFFRKWFGRLTAADLASTRAASLAEALVEAKPEKNLPRLRAVLDRANSEELLAIGGHAHNARWGPRRTLVWLFERLVSFPEFFADCEACLFRLASHETEPQIGNNATSVWKELFSVRRSGTATPFAERIEVLRKRTSPASGEAAKLGFAGIRGALQGTSGKLLGPTAIAGRLRPKDWEPQTAEEELNCYRAVLDLCGGYMAGDSAEHCELAFDVLAGHASSFLRKGLAEELRQALRPGRLSDERVRRLLNALDQFLAVEQRTGRSAANARARDYIRRVRDWADSLRPTDFDGRLRSVVARDPWDDRFAREINEPDDETDELAMELVRHPSRLSLHLDWLATREARSAGRLGLAIGRRDVSGECGNMIFEHAIARGAAPLLRGYVRGLAHSGRSPNAELLEWTDRLETCHPEVAVDILSLAGDAFDSVNRAVRLVEQNRVAAGALAVFALGVGTRNLSSDELRRILPAFLDAAREGEAKSAQAGVRFLATFFHFDEQPSSESCLGDLSTREITWQFAEASVPFLQGQIEYEWSAIVERLSSFDPHRAARLFGLALISDDFGVGREAETKLMEMAGNHPAAVMEGFGTALLHPDNDWRMQLHVFRELVERVPAPCLIEWVERHGLEGARAIARHLPSPYLDEEGRPAVPEVLEFVFDKYDDERLFRLFLAGTLSGVSGFANGAERYRRQAEDARRFLDHPNRWIREWAECQIDYCQRWAETEDMEHAERFLPS